MTSTDGSFRFIAGLCALLLALSLWGCGSLSSSSPDPYNAVIAEGRAAAREIMESTGASSISLALVDGEKLIWAETFVAADKAAAAPTVDTMYAICSVSKMVAAVAVMKLVDMGLVSLDAPVAGYIPAFSMLSPEYTQVTVRMLINHSSGFPGSDYRNTVTSSPLQFRYSAQVLETLKTQRLKHAPGYLSVYCNDGFTVVEELVLARTGKNYTQFVQDEIFTPLGMTRSRYGLNYFPDGSYAATYEGDTVQPQIFINAFGSGGLFSTPTDMARIAMMFIGRGKVGNVRILSEASVAAMGVDQTLTGFNPVKAYGSSYGLGWDTVVQPGLGAVGVTAWQKTGDFSLRGAVMTVAPAEKLGVVVAGASGGFNSGKANIIAERILLKALEQRGRIPSMPERLNLSSRPEAAATDAFLDSVSGHYANSTVFFQVRKKAGSLDLVSYDAATGGWKELMTGLKHRDDGRFATDSDPSRSVSFITAEGRRYLVLRTVNGYGHYQDDIIMAQQVAAAGGLPAPWASRSGKTWLLTNEHPESPFKWAAPLMQLPAVDGFLLADTGALQVVDPSFSDSRAAMMLLIPQMQGKELDDVVIEARGAEEWIRFGSYLYRPFETVPVLTGGPVTIGAEGLGEWRLLDATGVTRTVAVSAAPTGSWRIYDSGFTEIERGRGSKNLTLSNGIFYLLFHHDANVNLP